MDGGRTNERRVKGNHRKLAEIAAAPLSQVCSSPVVFLPPSLPLPLPDSPRLLLLPPLPPAAPARFRSLRTLTTASHALHRPRRAPETFQAPLMGIFDSSLGEYTAKTGREEEKENQS